jgi:hypothetical protein
MIWMLKLEALLKPMVHEPHLVGLSCYLHDTRIQSSASTGDNRVSDGPNQHTLHTWRGYR